MVLKRFSTILGVITVMDIYSCMNLHTIIIILIIDL